MHNSIHRLLIRLWKRCRYPHGKHNNHSKRSLVFQRIALFYPQIQELVHRSYGQHYILFISCYHFDKVRLRAEKIMHMLLVCRISVWFHTFIHNFWWMVILLTFWVPHGLIEKAYFLKREGGFGRFCFKYWRCRSMRPTFKPNVSKRAKVHGFRKRMSSKNGRKVLAARRLKGRKVLSA